MPTGVKNICGFIRDSTTGNFGFLNEKVTETLRVEAYNVTDTLMDIQDSLPAYGTASGNMPDGTTITFTIHISRHPHRSRLLLLSAPSIRKVKGSGAWWDINLTYGMDADKTKTTNPEQENPGTQNVIVLPWQQPPIWNFQTTEVDHDSFVKRWSGEQITMTNGLPITRPIRRKMSHEVNSFTFNIAWNDLDIEDIRKFKGMLNKQTLWGHLPGTVKCRSISINEQFKRMNTQTDEADKFVVHFAQVQTSFEYNPMGWAPRILSASTLQAVPIIATGTVAYLPIPTNERGDFADEPWPLDINGLAIPYEDVKTAQEDFVYIDTEDNHTAQPGALDIWKFANAYKLYSGKRRP
jgi:hypothetical protein